MEKSSKAGSTLIVKAAGCRTGPIRAAFRAMPGNHADAMITDAMVKGIGGFDYATAYEALRKDAFTIPVAQPGQMVGGKGAMEEYLRLGYVPARKTEYWVSMTLDYAYDDWCVAQAAKRMGKTDDYRALMKRSQNYRNLWDSSTGFMRSKDENGNWSEPNFDQYAWGGPYTESGPWQSSWGVQHDALGLADLTGGPVAFGKVLDDLFSQPPIFKTGSYNGVIPRDDRIRRRRHGSIRRVQPTQLPSSLSLCGDWPTVENRILDATRLPRIIQRHARRIFGRRRQRLERGVVSAERDGNLPTDAGTSELCAHQPGI